MIVGYEKKEKKKMGSSLFPQRTTTIYTRINFEDEKEAQTTPWDFI